APREGRVLLQTATSTTEPSAIISSGRVEVRTSVSIDHQGPMLRERRPAASARSPIAQRAKSPLGPVAAAPSERSGRSQSLPREVRPATTIRQRDQRTSIAIEA